MRIETFFENFDGLIDGPDAVMKVRELVLQLATHGKLIAQLPEDEPASELVEHIKEYLKLLRGHDSVRYAPLEPVDIEGFLEIPPTWQWVRLGDVVEYGSRDKIESVDIQPDAWLLDLEDIEKDTSRILQRKRFHDSPSKSTKTVFGVGDVLYGKLRPYLNKVIVADAPGYCTTEIVPIRTFGFIDPNYLCYALKRPAFLTYANSKSYGMNLPRLGTDDARRAPIPIPPLAEQKRIVAKVDELMALCDRLKAQLRERDTRQAVLAHAALARFAEAPTLENLDLLFHNSFSIDLTEVRKQIIVLAMQGKLVPQDVNDAPADDLLDTIATQCRTTRISHSTSGTQPVLSPPFDLPKGWAWSRFPELGEFGRGKSKHRPRNDRKLFIDGKYPLVQTGDVARANGAVQTYTNLYNDEGLAQSKMWPSGTLCITIAANIADSGILGFDACFPDSIVGFIPAGIIPSVRFFEYFMRTVKERLEEFAPSTAQKNINLGILEKVWVPIPPVNEQRRIVAKLDQLMALVDQLESQITATRSASAALLDAMIQELLNPRAISIELANTQQDVLGDRAAIGCYVISKMANKPYFGRTAAMKILYLAEAHVGLKLGGIYEREAAGPLDQWIYQFQREGAREGWFEVIESNIGRGRTKAEYHTGHALKAKGALASSVFTNDQRKEFDRLLRLFSDMKTENVEIVTTLFAAWNDFLIDGYKPSDDEIIREVRENWHASKKRFSPTKLATWLDWMRQKRLIPQGRPPRTMAQTRLNLN